MSNLVAYESQRELVAALVRHQSFPHAVKSVRVIETHISWVLLAGRFAYKIKKAVNLGFLDFSSLGARRKYCEEEIRLNRRLAPGIYLDTIAIGGEPGRPVIGMLPAIEYAVRMRRFATTRQLDRLLARGKLVPEVFDRLAAVLASFHAGILQAEQHSMFGAPSTILDAAMQNFDQLQSLLTAPSDCEVVARLKSSTLDESAACRHIFEQRRGQGFVRECHGDLHLGNIVLAGEQPVPFDGIEFNPGLRWIDVMSEVAFLMMDLLHGRRADLAYRFLNAWLESTGDYAGLSVLHFYLAYRAAVRAKIHAIRAFQSGRGRKRELATCRGYLALAGECFIRRRMLIIMHGLPGSGKSTFAMTAAGRLQAIRIRSDVERKRLFGMGPLDLSRSSGYAGIYSADATRRTYARLHELAGSVLHAGFPAIIDAAFLKREERDQFHQLAQELKVPFAIVSMQADAGILQARIRQRQEHAADASEADMDVLHMLQVSRQPLLQHELACTFSVSNEDDVMKEDAGVWRHLDKLLAG